MNLALALLISVLFCKLELIGSSNELSLINDYRPQSFLALKQQGIDFNTNPKLQQPP
jgi:hypothetical protein